MKVVLITATVLMAAFAQAASSYDCTFETAEGPMQALMTPVDATTMQVTIAGEVSVCQYDESQEAVNEINANMSANGVTMETEVVVGCEGQTMEDSLYALVSKSDIVAEGVAPGTNTVILSPVVGPVAVGFCTKK